MLENFIYFTPLFVMLCGIMALLFDDHNEEEYKQCFKFSRTVLLISFVLAVIFYNKPLIANICRVNELTLLFELLLYTAGFLLFGLSQHWFASMKIPAHTFCGGVFIAISSAYVLITSVNLTLTFATICLMLSGNYILYRSVAIAKEDNYMTKNYLICMLICTGLFGAILIWLSIHSQNLNYTDIQQLVFQNIDNPQYYLFCCGLVIIVAFLLFLAPLHILFVEILSKAALPVAFYFMFFPQITGLAAFINLRSTILLPLADKINIFAQTFAIISIIIGAFGACCVSHLRKIIAYIILFHIGIVFMLLQNNTFHSVYAALLYLLVIFLAISGLCTCLFGLKIKGEYPTMLNDFAGAAQSKPFIAVVFSYFLFILAGFPPLLGFVSNFSLINYLLLYHHRKSLICILIMMVVVCCAYWRILQKIFFTKNEYHFDRTDTGINTLLIVLTCTGLFLAVKPYILTDEIYKILEQIFG